MVAAGASMIDVGGESTRPGADPVDSAVELQRVVNVVEAVVKAVDVPVSIDTMKSVVARAAVEVGRDVCRVGRGGCLHAHARHASNDAGRPGVC